MDEELFSLMSCLFSLLRRSVQRKIKQLKWAEHTLEVPPFSVMASARAWLFLLVRTNTITGEEGVKEHHSLHVCSVFGVFDGLSKETNVARPTERFCF